MIISDGNGNRYSAGPAILFYDPVTPAQSSSGMYSGGQPAAVFLTQAERRALDAQFDRAVLARDAHAPTRAKGTLLLERSDSGAKASVLLKGGSKPAVELEAFLKKLMAEALRRIPRMFHITRDRNPWSGMTDTAAQEERNRMIRASSVPAEGFSPLTAPELQYQGRPHFYRSEAAKEIIVDATAFSAIERPDATRMKPGEERLLGRALKSELLEPHRLLPLLLNGQMIITYWHTDAEIRFVGEESRAGRSCYLFEGEHHYYTNEKNTDPVRFAVCVDGSKQIFVVGR
jgi:hypothetical protein